MGCRILAGSVDPRGLRPDAAPGQPAGQRRPRLAHFVAGSIGFTGLSAGARPTIIAFGIAVVLGWTWIATVCADHRRNA